VDWMPWQRPWLAVVSIFHAFWTCQRSILGSLMSALGQPG